MKTALTVITTAILTAIAFLFAWQNGLLGNNTTSTCPTISCPTANLTGEGMKNPDTMKCDLDATGAPCSTPWGENIAHGKSVLSFKQETGTGTYQCEALTSTCNDGSRRKDKKPYPFASCSLGEKSLEDNILVSKNCKLGDVIIPHDTTYTFYKEIKEGNKYVYKTAKRYCFDGKLEGDETYNKINMLSTCQPVVEKEVKAPVKKVVTKPSYKAPTKPVTPPKPKYNRCTSPSGKIREHGKGASYYLQETVPYGSVCQQVQVVCGYGSLRK